MKIAYHDHTENADAASIARILADRLGDDAVQLAPSLLHAGSGRTGQEEAPARETWESRHRGLNTLLPTPEARFGGVRHRSGSRPASPACTRLIVMPRDSTGVSAEAIERFASETQVPTLVVHGSRPLLAWLRGERTLRVLCAHDLTTTADDALRFVKQLRQAGPCEIVLAHVHRTLEERTHAGCTNVGAMRKHDLDVWHALQHELRNRARRVLGEEDIEIRVNPAPLRRDNLILELVDETAADLVVTGLHPHDPATWVGAPATVSRALLRFGLASLVLVPPAVAAAPSCAPSRGIRRVLVVTDFTPACEPAIRHGFALLGRGGTLRLAHVIHPDALPDSDYDRNLTAGQQQAAHGRLVETRSNQLRAAALVDGAAPGVHTETEIIEHRDSAIAIAQAAERFDADLVCLALPERPTLFTTLFRSKIRSVLARSNRPLLIVQPATS
jgi:nucleotide-binding universal stress UspA family protein